MSVKLRGLSLKKDNKSKKNGKFQKSRHGELRFELEDDADSLMERYLDQFKPLDKDAESHSEGSRQDKKGRLKRRPLLLRMS